MLFESDPQEYSEVISIYDRFIKKRGPTLWITKRNTIFKIIDFTNFFWNPDPNTESPDEIIHSGKHLRRFGYHEVFIHQTLSKRWDYYRVIPFESACQWKDKSNNQPLIGIEMVRSEGDLKSMLQNETTPEEIISEDLCDVSVQKPVLRRTDVAVLVFQLLVGLDRLQKDFNFYHADLTANHILVYLGRCSPPLETNGFILPDRGVAAFLCDFGLSSITVGEKQHELLSYFHGDPYKNTDVDDPKAYAYDTQFLFGRFPWEKGSTYDECLAGFWNRLQQASLGTTGTNSEDGEPQVLSYVTPWEIIQEVFGTNPEPWYDFRKK